MNILKIKAYTLTEMIVAVISLGVIASFAVPNYSRSIDKAQEKDAKIQLIAAHSAEQIYRAKSGIYWPKDTGDHDIVEINSHLGLNIVPSGMTYSCTGNAGGTVFTCTAAKGGTYTLMVDENPIDTNGTAPDNPCCSSGTCPTTITSCPP